MRKSCGAFLIVASASMLASSEGTERKEELSFSRAAIRIELHATDEDVGIQVLLDGEPWKRVRMFNPRDRVLLDIVSQGSLRRQGLTELFFESSEPSLEEVSLPEFLARFPAGTYELEGLTLEGVELEGEATLTHAIPRGAEILHPLSATDDPPVVDPANAVFEWLPVTESIAGAPVEIVGYELIVEQPQPLRVLSLHLPPSVTSVAVPAEFFLLPGTLHKFEVLAIERSGNQTIQSGQFVTTP